MGAVGDEIATIRCASMRGGILLVGVDEHITGLHGSMIRVTARCQYHKYVVQEGRIFGSRPVRGFAAMLLGVRRS